MILNSSKTVLLCPFTVTIQVIQAVKKMLPIYRLFVFFSILMNFALARPNEQSSVEPESDMKVENLLPIPSNGVVYGMIVNFTSPENIQSFESLPTETDSEQLKDQISNGNGEKLVRKKRFLFGIIGSALESLRSDNWRECGRTPWGTTIYTNGFATACFGACPENVYCGYGYGGYGNGYGTQINTVYFG